MPELPAAITGLAGQKATSRLVAEAQRLANSRDGAGPARGQVITQALTARLNQAGAFLQPSDEPSGTTQFLGGMR